MGSWKFPGPVLLLAFTLGAAAGQPPVVPRLPPPEPSVLLDGKSLEALSGSLRGYLVRNLPPLLYQANPGWGNTSRVANGVKWRGQGFRVHPELQYTQRNDGSWRKIYVTAGNLQDTLIFDLRNLQHPEPGKMTFQVFTAFDARADVQQQNWESGVRLYDGSVRARFRVRLHLQCEATTRLEPNGSLLPDAVFRLRVLQASLQYDNLVVEHVAGLGGEAAKVLGDAARGTLRQLRPSLERELLAKAEAALVRAGDTKEVRLSLAALLRRGQRGPPVGRGSGCQS